MGIRKTFTEMKSEDFGTIKVGILRLYSSDDELVNIELCPAFMTEDGNIFWDRYDSLRIYRADYEHFMIPVFEEIFPVTDPDPKGWGIQENFDAAGENWLCAEEWLRLKDMLAENSRISSPEEQGFYDEVLRYFAWAENKSGLFCISGNL